MQILGKYIQQAVFYTSAAVLFYSLTLGLSWGNLVWIVISSLLGSLLISAYYHRMLCHQAWRPPYWVEVVMAVMTAGHGLSPAISWVAVHRKHHRYSDTHQDPHGPHLMGLAANSLLAFYKTDLKYAGNLLRSRLYQFQLKYYFYILIVYTVIWSLLFGLQSWFIINGYVLIMQTLVNYFGHRGGRAVNVKWVSILSHGELHHKNHHDDPQTARFGPWDIPYAFIRILRVDR